MRKIAPPIPAMIPIFAPVERLFRLPGWGNCAAGTFARGFFASATIFKTSARSFSFAFVFVSGAGTVDLGEGSFGSESPLPSTEVAARQHTKAATVVRDISLFTTFSSSMTERLQNATRLAIVFKALDRDYDYDDDHNPGNNRDFCRL